MRGYGLHRRLDAFRDDGLASGLCIELGGDLGLDGGVDVDLRGGVAACGRPEDGGDDDG